MIFKNRVLGLAIGVGLTSFGASAAPPAGGSHTNQLIIRLQDDGLRRIQAVRRNDVVPDLTLADGRAMRLVRRLDSSSMVVRLPEEISLEQARQIAGQLAVQAGVAGAEPDRRVYPALVPNDVRYPDQWHLFEDTAGIRMPTAWDHSTGSGDLVIAALDTGILSHSDLNASRILPGYDFISNPDIANDGDGRDPDPTDPGDAVAADECGSGDPAEDSSWHGLAVAGVMVAESDNSIGIAGIDFAARLLPLRVLGKCGGFTSDIIDAVRWAAGLPIAGVPDNPYPARVINLSLSGEGQCTAAEQDAINDAVNAGSVVVVAAGNEGGDVANKSPASCKNVITVGAVGRDGSRASYLNVGEQIDLSAPGGDTPDPPDALNPPSGIWTLWNNGTTGPAADTFAAIQGTSFTTAQVSAVVSLMFAVNPTLTPVMVENLLRLTARPFPDTSCTINTCGAGILDADAALVGAADPSILGVSTDLPGDGGGGGGGCSIQVTSKLDPLLWLLALLAVAGVRLSRRNGA